MGEVISIMKPVKNPSKSFMESVRKARGVRGKAPNREQRRFSEKWYKRINYNIDYYKAHGKLPKVDMAKVQGKGMYGNG